LFLIIDLCCGLGRWDNEDVISIDSDIKTKPTICADIRYLPLRRGLKPDHVHASPPCRYFSYARFPTHPKYDFKGIGESLRIVAACFEAIDYLEAKHWTLENPAGHLGKLFNEKTITYKAGDYQHKKTHFWSDTRGLKRAIIPQDVRQAILTDEGEC